jgi:hypothetical protein
LTAPKIDTRPYHTGDAGWAWLYTTANDPPEMALWVSIDRLMIVAQFPLCPRKRTLANVRHNTAHCCRFACIPKGYAAYCTQADRQLALMGASMSLQEFAELGAAMSGVGVIASVIYVSIQIRHNTRAVRASAFQQVVNSFAAISFDIAKDKNLVDLYMRAGRDFPALDEVERAQYSLMLLSFLRRSENVFFRPRFACFTANIGPVSEKA